MASTRSPQEVFNHHAQALGAEDLEEIVADYSDDAVFITPAGVQRGKDGIRQAFTRLLSEVPQAAWDIKTTIYEGDILFLEWGAEGGGEPHRGWHRHLRLPRWPDPGPDRPLHPAACSLTEGECDA
jgi:ketosteroid isomerase-like protein